MKIKITPRSELSGWVSDHSLYKSHLSALHRDHGLLQASTACRRQGRMQAQEDYIISPCFRVWKGGGRQAGTPFKHPETLTARQTP